MGKAPASTVFDQAVTSSLYVDHSVGGFQFHRQDSQNITDIRDYASRIRTEGLSRTTALGRSELLIPVLVLHQLKQKYPDLASPDRMTKVKAWKKFMASTEAKPWRVSRPRYVQGSAIEKSSHISPVDGDTRPGQTPGIQVPGIRKKPRVSRECA